MSKNNNTEYFDGHAVTQYGGRFSGSFDLPEDVGESMRYDDVVTFLVTSVVSEAKVVATKAGDLKRVNTLDVVEVREIDDKAHQLVINTLNNANQPQVPPPSYTQPVIATVVGDDDDPFAGIEEEED